MKAYENTIRNTATKRAPWYVVPADNKWFTRVVVAAAVIEALSSLDLAFPPVSEPAERSGRGPAGLARRRVRPEPYPGAVTVVPPAFGPESETPPVRG